jgi:hypothetical protein
MPTKKNAKSKMSKKVVSAFVFDGRREEPDGVGRRSDVEKVKKPITASVFVNEESDLTFTTRIRNLIQYTVDVLRDHLAGQTPIDEILQRSIKEMKLLSADVARRLNADTSKRFHDLIEEMTAFMYGDKTDRSENDDLKDVMHYRHYVRIAWISHFILEDLRNFRK